MVTLFSGILNMSLTGSVVILLVLGARLLLRRSPKRFSYALWAVVLFRLLCSVSLSGEVSALGLLQPEVTVSARGTASTVSYLPAPNVQRQTVPTQAMAAPVPAGEARAVLDPMDIAAWVWLAGVGVMVVCSAVQLLHLRRRLTGAVRWRNNVFLADLIDTPFVLGLFRPRIYLPSGTPGHERRYILAHERHHIRRGDPVWKLLGYGALCLHWFNPLVWAAFLLAGKDMEMSCDEAVLRQLGEEIRADYAASLLRLATHRKTLPGMPLAFGEGDTKGRVKNMAKWKKPKRWAAALCGVLCVAVLAACALNPEKSLEDMTRTQGPAGCALGDLNLQIPQGYAIYNRENEDDPAPGNRYAYELVITDGTDDIGGVTAFYPPENTGEWNGWRDLNLPQWQDETLGCMADGSSIEFFSDVPDGVERGVQVMHTFFTDETYIYDVWFDELVTDRSIREEILGSAWLDDGSGVRATTPQEAALRDGEELAMRMLGDVADTLSSGSYAVLSEYRRDVEDEQPYASVEYLSDGNRTMRVAREGSGEGESLPWLLRIGQSGAPIAYIDTLTGEDGKRILMRVDAPYDDTPGALDFYMATMYLDPDGAFRKVELQVNIFREDEFFVTESILSQDADTVSDRMEAAQ